MANCANRQTEEDDDIVCDNGSLAKYEVKKLVGSGEFCDVFKAIHSPSGRTVALKRLKIRQMFNAKNRFDCLREIRLLRKLDHPNIIRHVESFFANNELFIALEYANAGDLSKMLDYFRKKRTCLSEKNVWNFFHQICSGLEYMHSQRVIHRDIKPANVLINRDGRVKLADFGLSLLLSATTENARSLVGTPYYMAPERLDELEYNFKADIWSMGCLLYELVTLYPPFYEPNQNLQMLIHKIRNLIYTPISYAATGTTSSNGYSGEIDYIIRHCLVIDSDSRIELTQMCSIASRMNDKFHGHEQPTLQAITKEMAMSHRPHLQHDQDTNSGHTVSAQSTISPSQSVLTLTESKSNSSSTVLSSGDISTYRGVAQSSSTQDSSFKKIYRSIKNIF